MRFLISDIFEKSEPHLYTATVILFTLGNKNKIQPIVNILFFAKITVIYLL